MKKMILAAAILIGCTLNSFAQEVAKTGLNFGPLPAVGYSSDLGWHYGALSDIYWYGDGSTYPDYVWKGNVEISRYSKGNTVLHSFFDSKYLIPGLRVSAVLSDSETPSPSWEVVRGDAEGCVKLAAQLVNPAERITAAEQATGAVEIALTGLDATKKAYLWVYLTVEDYTATWTWYSSILSSRLGSFSIFM